MNRIFLAIAVCTLGSGLFVEYLANVERPTPRVESDPREVEGTSQRHTPDSRHFVIDVRGLLPKFEALAEEQRADQLADWAVYGILSHAELSASDIRAATFEFAPIRQAALESVFDYDYGPGRRITLPNGAVWLVYNELDPHPRSTLAHLADRVRMERGSDSLPPAFGVFRYRTALDEGLIHVEREADIATDDVFSSRYGHVETVVSDVEGLKVFLDRIDNLSFVRLLPEAKVKLAGRRIEGARTLGVELDDVAALYQAHTALARAHEELEQAIYSASEPLETAWDELIQLYNDNVTHYNADRIVPSNAERFNSLVLRLETLLRESPDGSASSWLLNPSSVPEEAINGLEDFDRLLNAQYRVIERLKDRVWRRVEELQKGVVSEAVRQGDYPPAEPGFSLDPQWNAQQLIEDLRLLRDRPQDLIKVAYQDYQNVESQGYHPLARRRIGETAWQVVELFLRDSDELDAFAIGEADLRNIRDILAAAEGKTGRELEDGSILPFLKLQEDLKSDDSDEDDARLLVLLDHIESRNRAQCARYDGPLQGTRVGMNLFYTDLLAKLWASVDYYGEAPIHAIPGFLSGPQSGFSLEPSYWAERWAFPSTRLWFGVKPEGIKSADDGRSLIFGHIATRVYSAGSNPLMPGEETKPSEGSLRVFQWWDRNYQKVADYEQQYHLQNQIMKWSVVTGLLAENGHLSDLNGIAVRSNQRFDEWYAAESSLKFKHDVRFLPTTEWLGETECLEILRSYPYPSGGFLATHTEGGVSLGSSRTVNAAHRLADDIPVGLRRYGLDHSVSRPGKLQNLRGATFELPPVVRNRAVVDITPPPGARLRTGGDAFNFATLRTRVELDTQGGTILLDADSAALGTLRWRKTPNGVKLDWKDGQVEIARETMDSIRTSLRKVGNASDDTLALRLASEPAFLPRTGHMVIQNPGRPLQILPVSGAGGRFGGPPPIRGPPRAGGGAHGNGPGGRGPGGSGPGSAPDSQQLVILIRDDTQHPGHILDDTQPMLETSHTPHSTAAGGWSQRKTEVALVRTDQVEKLMENQHWQRLRPIARAGDDAPGDVIRIFSGSEPPTTARQVRLETGNRDLGVIEARWTGNELFLRRPADPRTSRAFNDLVVDEGITSTHLQRLGAALDADPQLTTLALGNRGGQSLGREAAYWLERGNFVQMNRVLREAADQGQLQAAVNALDEQVALQVGSRLGTGPRSSAARQFAARITSSVKDAQPMGHVVTLLRQGKLDDALNTLKNADEALLMATRDPAVSKSLHAMGQTDVADFLRIRHQNVAGNTGPVIRHLDLEPHGSRLVKTLDISDLPYHPRRLTQAERQKLLYDIEQMPPERVYVQHEDLLGKLDWDGAPMASLARAARDPRIEWRVLEADEVASIRPTVLIAADEHRFIAKPIPEPRANPRPRLDRDLPPTVLPFLGRTQRNGCDPDDPDADCSSPQGPFSAPGGQQSPDGGGNRIFLLSFPCVMAEESSDTEVDCDNEGSGETSGKPGGASEASGDSAIPAMEAGGTDRG